MAGLQRSLKWKAEKNMFVRNFGSCLRPAVSICMATFNGERFIGAQISSILGQMEDRDELLVSDDGSTDGTVDVVLSFRDPRIRLLRCCQFRSPVYNFEHALSHATGDLIFLADQDDVWHERKLEILSGLLQSYDLVTSDCVLVDEYLNVLHPSYFRLRRCRPGLLRNLMSNQYVGCCMAMRRRVAQAALPFPPHLPMHDWWIAMLGEALFRTSFCEQGLVLYRRHDFAASSTGRHSRFSVRERLLHRMSLAWHIARRALREKRSKRVENGARMITCTGRGAAAR